MEGSVLCCISAQNSIHVYNRPEAFIIFELLVTQYYFCHDMLQPHPDALNFQLLSSIGGCLWLMEATKFAKAGKKTFTSSKSCQRSGNFSFLLFSLTTRGVLALFMLSQEHLCSLQIICCTKVEAVCFQLFIIAYMLYVSLLNRTNKAALILLQKKLERQCLSGVSHCGGHLALLFVSQRCPVFSQCLEMPISL